MGEGVGSGLAGVSWAGGGVEVSPAVGAGCSTVTGVSEGSTGTGVAVGGIFPCGVGVTVMKLTTTAAGVSEESGLLGTAGCHRKAKRAKAAAQATLTTIPPPRMIGSQFLFVVGRELIGLKLG
jgi:hypothetical protein